MANNKPFAAAFAVVPIVIMAIYLSWIARSRRVRGALSHGIQWGSLPGSFRVMTILMLVFLYVPLASWC